MVLLVRNVIPAIARGGPVVRRVGRSAQLRFGRYFFVSRYLFCRAVRAIWSVFFTPCAQGNNSWPHFMFVRHGYEQDICFRRRAAGGLVGGVDVDVVVVVVGCMLEQREEV